MRDKLNPKKPDSVTFTDTRDRKHSMDMVRKGIPVLGKTHTDSWIGMHDDGKTIHTSTRGDSGFTADCTKHSVEAVNNLDT